MNTNVASPAFSELLGRELPEEVTGLVVEVFAETFTHFEAAGAGGGSSGKSRNNRLIAAIGYVFFR